MSQAVLFLDVPPRGPFLELPFAGPPSKSDAGRERAPEPEPLSVAELDRLLKRAVEREGHVRVAGEVTQVREVASGHVYFALADELEDATIDCVLYRAAVPQRDRRLLVSGARVVLGGRATIWAPRGRLQFTVDQVRPLGKGALLEALEELKQKLLAEGLFAQERKRPLPIDPRVVGVVTSSDGAAIHDVVTVAFRRGAVRIVLARAPVQGPTAAERIARALDMLARHPEVEVIVLARGGGSADDLAAYNDEALVRRIAACRVPVVSAVGHETDVSLADLVADARAATPSQAAEMVVPDDAPRRSALAQLVARLGRAVDANLRAARQTVERGRARLVQRGLVMGDRSARLARLERRLSARHPETVIASTRALFQPLEARLAAAIHSQLGDARAELGAHAARLDALSPLSVLARGYAIARDESGKALTNAAEVEIGGAIDVRLHRGRVFATVDSIETE